MKCIVRLLGLQWFTKGIISDNFLNWEKPIPVPELLHFSGKF